MFTHCQSCKKQFLTGKKVPGELVPATSRVPVCMFCLQNGKRPPALMAWAKRFIGKYRK